MLKLTELFGEDSFDSPIHDPWEILIGSTKEHHCLAIQWSATRLESFTNLIPGSFN